MLARAPDLDNPGPGCECALSDSYREQVVFPGFDFRSPLAPPWSSSTCSRAWWGRRSASRRPSREARRATLVIWRPGYGRP